MTSRRPGDLVRLEELLDSIPQRIVACSGGVDSVLLATVAHRQNPRATVVAHTVTPAVPSADTAPGGRRRRCRELAIGADPFQRVR
jgi:PP-loop superfamily ATP-utilizing enzyme